MSPDEIKAANDELMRSYRLCFGGPGGRPVMNDLMKFCKFRVHAENEIEEGMRRVFLRIINLVNLTDEQLYQFYAGHDVGEEDA